MTRCGALRSSAASVAATALRCASTNAREPQKEMSKIDKFQELKKLKIRPLYLDAQATSPVDPRVLDAMLPYLTTMYGNPHSRTHAYGWESEKAVEEAREVTPNFSFPNDFRLAFYM